MKSPIITFENIFFSYEHDVDNLETKYILKGISFLINKGDYICIVGHNGSGKSTLSKILSCLLKPQSGNIYINSVLLNENNIDTLRRKIGIIFQNPDNQFIGLTTEDDIAFGLENYCVKSSKIKEIIHNSARVINITDLLNRESFNLSGGQKQKVAITSSIALFPEIIIFDESTTMLDPKSKRDVINLMKFLQKQHNITIISITHDMEEIKNASMILCVKQGKVAKFCTVGELVNDYKFLKESKLDLPFNLKLLKLLKDKGLKVKLTLDDKQLVSEICKS